jgi:two-component system, cell cycle response regulator
MCGDEMLSMNLEAGTMKFSKRVFIDLAVKMIGFGIAIGIVFPFFVLIMGVPASIALSNLFIFACILAGIMVGAINIVLSKTTVGKKLKTITDRMKFVKGAIIAVSESGDVSGCDPEHCSIKVDSDDEFGQSAAAFNELIEAFSKSLMMQDTIRTYTEILSSQLELQTLAGSALDILAKYSSATAGAILTKKDGEIELLASYGIHNAGSLAENQILINAINKGEQYVIQMPDDLVIESVLTDFHPKEVIVEPVKLKNVPIAVLMLASVNTFAVEFKKQVGIFSRGLALALNNALEHDLMQKLAALDALTGVLNRRFGLVRLREEFTRSIRSEVPLSVLMLDIDHFKNVNDTYGHVVGDRILKNITQQIKHVMREGDILMRYGGEEFLLILPGASKNDSYAIAERIRHAIKDGITTYGTSNIGVTVSIGCDSYPETNVSLEQDLIVNADEALYRAKNSGRDKCVVH